MSEVASLVIKVDASSAGGAATQMQALATKTGIATRAFASLLAQITPLNTEMKILQGFTEAIAQALPGMATAGASVRTALRGVSTDSSKAADGFSKMKKEGEQALQVLQRLGQQRGPSGGGGGGSILGGGGGGGSDGSGGYSPLRAFVSLGSGGLNAGLLLRSLNPVIAAAGIAATTASAGFDKLASGIIGIGQAALDAGMEMDKIKAVMLAVAGGEVTAAGDAFKYAKGQADKFGISLQEAAKGYGKLAAAAEGTQVAGKNTKVVFEALSTAATVLRMDTDSTNGMFKAFTDMLSKGKVSAEELRRQLGNHLPGAFNLAATSMGITTGELDKMLKAGKLTTEEFIVKFSLAIRNKFGPALEFAANTVQANMHRMENSFFLLKASFGEESGLKDALGAAFKGIALALSNIQDAMDTFAASPAGKAVRAALVDIGAAFGDLTQTLASQGIDLLSSSMTSLLSVLQQAPQYMRGFVNTVTSVAGAIWNTVKAIYDHRNALMTLIAAYAGFKLGEHLVLMLEWAKGLVLAGRAAIGLKAAEEAVAIARALSLTTLSAEEVATISLTASKNAAAAATVAEAVAERSLAAARALAPGGITLITTLLVAGAAAWYLYGNKAKEAALAAVASTGDTLANLQAQVALLKKKNDLADLERERSGKNLMDSDLERRVTAYEDTPFGKQSAKALADIQESIRLKKLDIAASAQLATYDRAGGGSNAVTEQTRLNELVAAEATARENMAAGYMTFLAKKTEEQRQEARTAYTDPVAMAAKPHAQTKEEKKELSQYDAFLKKMEDEVRMRESLGKVEKDETKWWNEALKLKIAAKDAEGNFVPGSTGNQAGKDGFTRFENVRKEIDFLRELKDIEEQNKQTKKDNLALEKQEQDAKDRLTAEVVALVKGYKDLENPMSKYQHNLDLIAEAEKRGLIDAAQGMKLRKQHYTSDTVEGATAARLAGEAVRMNESARGGSTEGQMEKLNALMATGSLNAEVYKHRWYEIRKAGEDAFGTMLKLGENFADTLGDAFSKMAMGMKIEWRTLLADMMAQAAKAYASEALRTLLKLAITWAFTPGTPTENVTQPDYGPVPNKASGGGLYGGASYMVGEHGAERFIPSQNGTILPAGAGNVNNSIGSISIQVTVENNGKEKGGSSTESSGMGNGMAQALRGAVVDEINRQKMPGGVLYANR